MQIPNWHNLKAWSGEGMVLSKKGEKKSVFVSFCYSIQGPGLMAHAPQAGMGDSAS